MKPFNKIQSFSDIQLKHCWSKILSSQATFFSNSLVGNARLLYLSYVNSEKKVLRKIFTIIFFTYRSDFLLQSYVSFVLG